MLEQYVGKFGASFDDFKKEFDERLQLKKTHLEISLIDDEVLSNFERFFITLDSYSYQEILMIIEEGEKRYKNAIPPGYMDDEGKIGFQKYGDLIVWKEILRQINLDKKDVILVTNDLKEDWWHISDKSRPNFPRYELIKEFNDVTNMEFWMYDMNQFLYKSQIYLNTEIEEQVIEEVKYFIEPSINFTSDEQIVLFIKEYLEINDKDELISENKNDYGIDLILRKNDDTVGIVYKKTNSGRYTSLLLPIKNTVEKKEMLRDFLNINQLIVFIITEKEEIAQYYITQTERKNPKRLLSTHRDLRLVIVFNNGSEMKMVFDNKK